MSEIDQDGRQFKCTECPYVFTETEILAEDKHVWGHPCYGEINDPPGMRCESFRQPYVPNMHLVAETADDNFTLLQRTSDNNLRCGRCSAEFKGDVAQGTVGRNFEETEPEFRAALTALDYMNFDTGMETVRDDAAEIAIRIAAIYAAREEVVEGMAEQLKYWVRVLSHDDRYNAWLSKSQNILTAYAQPKEQR